jgi:GNAT superfamily N-acetyltransferase
MQVYRIQEPGFCKMVLRENWLLKVNGMETNDRVRIEPAGKEDAAILADICKRAFNTDAEYGAPGEGGPPGYDSPEAQTRFMKFLDYYKILFDEKIVGGLMVGSAGKEHMVLERIFVDPDLFRKGIGTASCNLLWEMYPDAKLWTLGTPEWNVRTKEFYENLGFVQVGWDLGDPDWRGRWYQRMDGSDPYKMLRIGELKDGMRNVTVEGEILEKTEPRMVRSRKRGEPLSVANASMGDETGRIVLVLWNEQIGWVTVGDRVRVENGYVSSYKGIRQLSAGRMGRLIVLM